MFASHALSPVDSLAVNLLIICQLYIESRHYMFQTWQSSSQMPIHSYAFSDSEDFLFHFGSSIRLFQKTSRVQRDSSDNLIERQVRRQRSYPFKEKAKKNGVGTPGSTFYVCGSGRHSCRFTRVVTCRVSGARTPE